MSNRKEPLTPWGKAVKIAMLQKDISPKELVEQVRAKGPKITATTLSRLLSCSIGQRSPEMVAAIDEILGIPPEVIGRPA